MVWAGLTLCLLAKIVLLKKRTLYFTLGNQFGTQCLGRHGQIK